VFRVLPVFNTIKPITDQQYWRFVEAHCEFQSIMVAEDNSDMLESYIMVNPSGCFFQNVSLGGGYLYSAPILSVGAERAFQVMGFDEHKFSRRYLRESHSDEA
jgi:radical S-adenosyl methionine domain-containing protein 2